MAFYLHFMHKNKKNRYKNTFIDKKSLSVSVLNERLGAEYLIFFMLL